VVGIIFYVLFKDNSVLGIDATHLVSVPVPDSFDAFKSQFNSPDFSAITSAAVWVTAFTMALVASLETLLCVEATDKIDPNKNVTPTNRELLAQGAGNIVSGMIGGLPITQVIVRSSANIQSGGRSKLSAIIHGLFLLLSVIVIPNLLNKIPLSVLAAVLLIVGYKLAKPSVFKAMWSAGWRQFIPFIVTVVILQYNLLIGVAIGLAVGIVITLFQSYKNSHFLHKLEEDSKGRHHVNITLAEEVTFFNKATILKELDALPNGTYLDIDVRKTNYLDFDVIEILEDFAIKAKQRNIHIKLYSERGTIENPESFLEFFKLRSTSN
jgi:MFS superfamily sulfate permease-like transporter